jgi:tetratricopeptide (TPR) repeat protein/transcriptional regulator with XRE-family HTH domain
MMAAQSEASFGTLLKRYREAANLTQEELAAAANVSVDAISTLERGVRRAPRPDTVQLLIRALHLRTDERTALEAAVQRRRGPPTRSAAPQEGPPLPADSGSPSPGRPVLPALVGRRDEQAVVARHLAGSPEGSPPPVLLLAGEPGIGKSRLLHEAAAWGTAQGWQVLRGGCTRRGGQDPYIPLVEALAAYVRGREPRHLCADLEGCAWLVRLLPELAGGPIEPLPAWTLDAPQERRLMVNALVRFLTTVAGGGRGALLVLDDLQWAGGDALDLLRVLAHTAGDIPLRVVGAYRDSEAEDGTPLAALLADLAQARLASHCPLRPLAPAEARQLAAGLLADVEDAAEVTERVLQRAGGLPFFVISCAEALRQGGTEAGGAAVPWDAAQSVRQRVRLLSHEAQEVLDIAAVAGQEVRRTLLTQVAALPARAVAAALQAACRAHLLEDVAPARYRFVHDLIREVVEADVGTARRTLLHEEIARALEQLPGDVPVEALAYHYAQTEEHAKAAHWLEQAGDRASVAYAHATAVSHYTAAQEQLKASGATPLMVAALEEKLAAVLHTLGHYVPALALLERTAETYRSTGDLEGLRRTLAEIGETHTHAGTGAEGLALLQSLLEVVETSEPTRGLAALYAALADLFYVTDQPSEYLQSAERAAGLARAVGDVRILAMALEKHAQALLVLRRPDDALPVVEETCRVAEAAGDLENLSWGLQDMWQVYLQKGTPLLGGRYLERALAVAERRGSPQQIATMLYYLGYVAFAYMGDWVRARAAQEQAIALNRRMDRRGPLVNNLLRAAEVCLAQGDAEASSCYLEEAVTAAEQNQQPDAVWVAQLLLTEHDLREGNRHAAHTRLVTAVKGAEPSEGWVSTARQMLPHLAWLHLEMGDVAEAAAVAAEIIARTRAEGWWGPGLVDALLVQASVAARQGRETEAEQAADEGLALARRLPYPYGEARLLHLMGRMHAERGALTPAREQLEAALAIFRRLGARRDSEQVERTLGILPGS